MYDYTLNNTNAIRSALVPYHLIDDNCVNFTDLVARAIGLKAQGTSLTKNHPQAYINTLKIINN